MNLNESDPTLEAVVFDAIRFVESLTTHFGPEKGMAVWDAMGDAVGREIKARVFFALMSGGVSGRVKMAAGLAVQMNAVPVIKCIRNYTGMGLKEAKDLWDESKLTIVDINVAPDRQRDFARELRNLGCNVL